MTRSRSDLSSFARDLCTDSSLAQHTARGILDRDPWLRDCAGLWIRLYAMHADGEISPPLGDEDAARLQACVEVGLCMFEERHGGHEDFVAALYSQVCGERVNNARGVAMHTFITLPAGGGGRLPCAIVDGPRSRACQTHPPLFLLKLIRFLISGHVCLVLV